VAKECDLAAGKLKTQRRKVTLKVTTIETLSSNFGKNSFRGTEPGDVRMNRKGGPIW